MNQNDKLKASSLNAADSEQPRHRLWYLYLLECADGTTYTGITTDPHRRLKQHNAGRAARYTAPAKRRPVRLLGVWRFPDRASATRTEARFKRRNAKNKRKLANQGTALAEAPFCADYMTRKKNK